MRTLSLFLIAVTTVIALASGAQAQTLAPGFVQEQLLGGLNPSAMSVRPDGTVYIVEKGGRILVYRDGVALPAPLLELDVDDFNERGLSGLSFHPDFDRNGLFYVYYTVPREGRNRLSRFRANGDLTVPGSEEVLMEFDQLRSTVHNGGAMVWLPDGTLLLAIGDGSDNSKPQDLNSRFGKMVRLRDDGTIPTDNPFYDRLDGDARAIYALGFRNPFTMARQPSTGLVLANDVGGSSWEEVNAIVAGGNYGWPLVEGRNGIDQAPTDHVEAVHEYDHGVGCAVIGAAFYEPSVASFPPEYYGKYLFGDYCRGWVRVLDPATGQVEGDIAYGLERVIAFGVDDGTGDLYYLARARGNGSTGDNTSTDAGTLWRIRYTGSGAPVVSRNPDDVLAPIGESATFYVSASGRPPYAYQWLRDGAADPADTLDYLQLDDVQLDDDGITVRAIVRNRFGVDTSAAATLRVTTNTRPAVRITRPATDATYAAGERIDFAGAATDAEDGDLGADALTWRVDFHHDDHRHPVTSLSGAASGSIGVPTAGEISANVFYRVTLTATDADGLAASTYVDVQPRVVDLTFDAEPSGLLLNADGLTEPAPFSVESVVGLERVLLAPLSQRLGDELYVFDSWSDGDDAPDRYYAAAPGGNAFTARYRPVDLGTGTGLTAKYYTGRDDDREFVFERVDSTVNFNWEVGAPDARMPADGFSVEWSGALVAPLTGRYNLTIGGDDGIRMYLNDVLVLDDYTNHAYRRSSVGFDLVAGEAVPIRIDYYEDGGGASATFEWASEFFDTETVPKFSLLPDVPAPTIDTTLSGIRVSVVTLAPGAPRVLLEAGADAVGEFVELAVFDNLGRQIARRLVALAGGKQPVTLGEPGRLPTATYHLRANFRGEATTTSFVVR